MYRVLPRNFVTTVLVVLGAALLGLVMSIWEWATGHPIDWWQVPRFINIAALAVVVLMTVVVQTLWRPLWRALPALNRWVFPDLNGTWHGELRSTWIDPDTGASPEPIQAALTVAQGWFDFSVRMRTDKMQSFSNRIFLERQKGTNVYRVWYGYRHEPAPASRPGNPPHDGMAFLEYDTDESDRLRGQYYTNRLTSGDFLLERK